METHSLHLTHHMYYDGLNILTLQNSCVEILCPDMPRCNGIRRWGLSEVSRIRQSHEDGAIVSRISALYKRAFFLCSALCLVRIREKSAVCSLEEDSRHNLTRLQTCEK